MNALKHGLTANNIVLTMENREKFESLRQTFLNELQPTNQVELDVVDQMVSAHWRLDRMMSLETASLDLELAREEEEIKKTFDAIDDDTRLAIAFKNLTDTSNNLANLSRYEARFRRNYERALRLLYELRGVNLRPPQTLAATPKPAEPPAPEPPPAPALRMQNEPNPISEHSGGADHGAGSRPAQSPAPERCAVPSEPESPLRREPVLATDFRSEIHRLDTPSGRGGAGQLLKELAR